MHCTDSELHPFAFGSGVIKTPSILKGDCSHMKQSCTTANIVCAARGIGISSTQRDPIAAQLAPDWTAQAVGLFKRDTTWVNAVRFALRSVSLGLVDHNTVRMLVIDEYLRAWLRAGCRQLVILGAGMDGRAWRMPELETVPVFELDQAATQRVKMARTRSLLPQQSRLRFVEVDLTAPALDQPLLRAGFCKEWPTAWVCEGVTPYLDVGAIARIWRSAAALSANGSRFAVSYFTPTQGGHAAVGRSLVSNVLSRLGEPARGAIPQLEMNRLITAAGLRALEDIGWKDWTKRVNYDFRLPNLLKERLVVAAKGNGP